MHISYAETVVSVKKKKKKHTDELCWFVGPPVDKSLKGLLHGIDEGLIPCEATLCNIVHLVLKV